MESQYQNFSEHLRKFLLDLDRYVPGGQGIKNFLQYFEKLDMSKVVQRYHTVIEAHKEALASKNPEIFSNSLVIFPDVNLSQYWQKLGSGQKAKIWTHMMILYIQSELVVNASAAPQSSKSESSDSKPKQVSSEVVTASSSIEEKKKSEEEEEEVFNPFVGVGSDNKQYSVDDISAGVKNLPNDQPSIGVGSIVKLVGLDKAFNMDELQEQLKNMDENDIKQATESIQGMLGNNVDPKTSSLISEMLGNIAEELQNDDLKSGDPFDSLTRIADKVSQKLKPKIEQEGVDMNSLWKSTQTMSGQLKDKDGNNIFGGNGPNPFDMLNRVMSGQMSEQECMQNCNTMLQGMGVDPNQVMQQYQQGQQGQPGQPGQPGQRRKPKGRRRR